MIKKLDDLIAEARTKGKKKLVVAYAEDAHTLEAVSDAVDMGIVEGILVGNPDNIKKVCEAEGIDFRKFTVIEENGDVNCVDRAVRMVNQGQGDLLMKGLVSTDKYMRGILNKEYGLLPPKGVLSHVTVMQIPTYHKLLLVSDVAIIPYPDFKQKVAIANYLIRTAKSLGIERPKVACIAPSEQMLSGVQSSEEAALLAKMGDRGQISGADIDGPLALDVAISKEVVETKKLTGSKVAGDADCLLMPSLDAANVFFKSVSHFANGELAAMVVGTKVPCILTSRGDSRKSKLNSIALACLSAK